MAAGKEKDFVPAAVRYEGPLFDLEVLGNETVAQIVTELCLVLREDQNRIRQLISRMTQPQSLALAQNT
jgi:hypothetical protein